MKAEEIKAMLLEVQITSLQAQLRALRRLKGGRPEEQSEGPRRSQVDLVEEVLRRAGSPLHMEVIVQRVEELYGVRLQGDSIVSALSKKVRQNDRFERTGPNEFGLLKGAPPRSKR